MNVFSRLFWQWGARRDAVRDLNSVEHRVTERLGPRPTFNPVDDPRHGQVVSDLNRSAEIGELEEDLRRVEGELARHTSPTGLLAGLGAIFFMEVLGALLVMKALGYDDGERVGLAITLALAVIFFTAVTSARSARSTDGSPATPARALATAIALLVYGALVLAVAVVRIHAGDAEASTAELVAEVVIMSVLSIGPAWLFEWLLRRRAPARLIHRERKLLLKRLKSAERSRDRALRERARIARAAEAWDASAERFRASYATAHRLVRSPSVEHEPTANPITRTPRRRS